MCEVNKNNFEEKYPQIIDDLESALFISIDCEFSGLFDDEFKCSLFDSPKRRFNNLQKSLNNIIIIQMGLSTFKYDRDKNSFNVSTYTFHLMPSTILENSKFVCHSRSLDFLCKHNFDFNKLFYNGINYLNKSSEAELLRLIEDKSLADLENSEKVQKYCSKIAQWSSGVPCESKMVLELDEDKTFVYLLHQEIRKRFNNLWTYLDDSNDIEIKKVKVSEKKELLLDKEEKISLEKKLFESILGFSLIMKKIQHLKKPIVGHNFLIDLILIYKQFYNPSPLSYKKFKEAITNLFPNVYDTKTISFRLRKFTSKEDSWHSNTLSDLYNYLTGGKGSVLVIYTPNVNHRNEKYIKEHNFHEAGFDSYCTGYCFLKMAHILSLWDEKKQSFLITPLPTASTWLLSAVQSMKNQVNFSRGQVNYIVLDGKDPESFRPDFLLIYSKTKKPLNVSKISQEIAKYSFVDIQLLNKYRGQMAVSNGRELKKVLEHFRNHDEVHVTKYNFLKHSLCGQMIVSGTVITSLSLILMWTLKVWSKV